MTTIADRDVGRANNFNLLRMLAALAVLVSHAWPLAWGAGTPEPLQADTGYKLGSTAVSIFFAVSGYFITKSFARRTALADFLLARVARIYPALLVVLVLTAAVLGPLVTEVPLGAYAASRFTWTYLPHNLLLQHPQWGLPGVFILNPGGFAINGSLWTLFYEVACYAAVIACGVVGLLHRRTAWLTVAAALVVGVAVPQAEEGHAAVMTALLFLPFALGGAAYVYGARVPLSGWIAAALVLLAGAVAMAAGTASPLYPPCHAAALSYGALWFGFALPGLGGYTRIGDYSYGVYIYAYPVGQLVVWSLPGCSPGTVIALSLPATLALAALSWHVVEQPALAHRHVLRRWRWKGRGVSAP